MNIFALDVDTDLAAEYHCDKHVVKMVLEYGQILSTAHRILTPMSVISPNIYRAAYTNHPSCRWARQSDANYMWLYSLFCSLHNEYKHRYGKAHKTFLDLCDDLSVLPSHIPKTGRLKPVIPAMPDHIKKSVTTFDESVELYRTYYRECKQHLWSWSNRQQPEWI